MRTWRSSSAFWRNGRAEHDGVLCHRSAADVPGGGGGRLCAGRRGPAVVPALFRRGKEPAVAAAGDFAAGGTLSAAASGLPHRLARRRFGSGGRVLPRSGRRAAVCGRDGGRDGGERPPDRCGTGPAGRCAGGGGKLRPAAVRDAGNSRPVDLGGGGRRLCAVAGRGRVPFPPPGPPLGPPGGGGSGTGAVPVGAARGAPSAAAALRRRGDPGAGGGAAAQAVAARADV